MSRQEILDTLDYCIDVMTKFNEWLDARAEAMKVTSE